MHVRVIRFSSLGDCILLCPFLEHLKLHGAESVSIVTRREYVELFTAARGVDQIVALDARTGMKGIQGIRRLVQDHRDDDYALVDAHDTLRSRIVARGLGGAEVRIDKQYVARLGLILFKRAATLPRMGERYSQLGEHLGFPAMVRLTGGIDIPEWARDRTRRQVGEPTGGIRVAFAPGGRWPMKRWDARRFAELARRVATKYDADIVLLGDERDAAQNARIAAAIGERARDVTGQTSVLEAGAILEDCDAFVGNDSGLMHLAEAVDTPVLAMFGPTVEAFGYYPSNARSKVVEREIDCRPCSRNGARSCPKGTQECLTGIPVDPVADAFDDLMAHRGPARYILH